MTQAVFISLAAVVVFNLMYHIAQKSVSPNANPLVSTAASYIVGIAVCAVLYPFFPQKAGAAELIKNLNWATVAVGLGAVGIEISVLLVYRSGWDISSASITFNAIVALLLIPIGLFFFSESFSWTKAAGILFCLIGLFLITRK
jgi:uncharacterized membrane protein YdcZ (DUF606 family)